MPLQNVRRVSSHPPFASRRPRTTQGLSAPHNHHRPMEGLMVRKVILILQTGGCLMARCYTYDVVIFAVLAGLIGMLGEVWLTRLSAPPCIPERRQVPMLQSSNGGQVCRGPSRQRIGASGWPLYSISVLLRVPLLVAGLPQRALNPWPKRLALQCPARSKNPC